MNRFERTILTTMPWLIAAHGMVIMALATNMVAIGTGMMMVLSMVWVSHLTRKYNEEEA